MKDDDHPVQETDDDGGSSSSMMKAICAWLKTFPELRSVTHHEAEPENVMEWLYSESVSRAILGIVYQVKEECSNDKGVQSFSSLGCWREMRGLLSPLDDSVEETLREIVCQAILETDGEDKQLYISRVLELDKEYQVMLMNILKQYKKEEENYDANDRRQSLTVKPVLDEMDEEEEKDRESPRKKARSGCWESSPTTISKGRSDKHQLHQENKFLLDTIERLRHEKDEALEREMKARDELDKVKGKAMKDCLHLESQLLERENDLKHEYEENISALQNDLAVSEERRKKNDRAAEELEAMKDELDVLKHSSSRLDLTEEQLRKCKAKLADFQDVRAQLDREEEARERAVQQVIELENELNTLAPLRRQLETYKSRATDAEVKLVDITNELEKLREQTGDLHSRNHELQKLSKFQQNESEELQRKLVAETESGKSSDGLIGLGEGMR